MRIREDRHGAVGVSEGLLEDRDDVRVVAVRGPGPGSTNVEGVGLSGSIGIPRSRDRREVGGPHDEADPAQTDP